MIITLLPKLFIHLTLSYGGGAAFVKYIREIIIPDSLRKVMMFVVLCPLAKFFTTSTAILTFQIRFFFLEIRDGSCGILTLKSCRK